MKKKKLSRETSRTNKFAIEFAVISLGKGVS